MFRFIALDDEDEYGHHTRYEFLLHTQKVLVRTHDQRYYSILDNGDLLIYKKSNQCGEPQNVVGIIIERANPMIQQLKEAIAEDAMDQILRG